MVELNSSDITFIEVDENTFTVTFHFKKTYNVFALTPENSGEREDLQYWWNSGIKRLIVRGDYAYAQNATGKWLFVDFENKRILNTNSNPLKSNRFISSLIPEGYIPPSVKIRRIRQKQL